MGLNLNDLTKEESNRLFTSIKALNVRAMADLNRKALSILQEKEWCEKRGISPLRKDDPRIFYRNGREMDYTDPNMNSETAKSIALALIEAYNRTYVSLHPDF